MEKPSGKIKKFFKGVCMVLSVVVVLFFIATSAITHKYKPYYGKVIDKETKEPLEGAAVLIVYKTEHYNLAGGITYFADAQETLTDKNGGFRIPANRIFTFRPLSGWERYPSVRIFKPGYGCYPEHKDVNPVFEYGSLPANYFVTIELPNVRTREERPWHSYKV
ncbi:MAG: hypothetical protein HY805_09440 [Nitrospirae bacterium]|nr:hypothetical protein [Nitrospirota bacterium]